MVNIGWLAVQLILSNGGSAFLPIRIAEPLLKAQKLFRVPDSPQFKLPAYMVSQRDHATPVLQQVVEILRALAKIEAQKTYSL